MTSDELRAWITERRRLAEAVTLPWWYEPEDCNILYGAGTMVVDAADMMDADIAFICDATKSLPVALDQIEGLLARCERLAAVARHGKAAALREQGVDDGS